MSKPIKVLHIIDHLGTGGAQEVVLNLYKFRDRNQFDVEVACMHGRGPYFDLIQSAGCRIYSLSPSKYWPLYFPRLMKLIMKRKYDVIQFHLQASNILAKPVAVFCKTPVKLCHDHLYGDVGSKSRIMLWLEKVTGRMSDHVIAVSRATAEFLVSNLNVPSRKISVIINGIDVDRFSISPDRGEKSRQQWNLPAGKIIVGGVGRLRHEKNFELFLQIAAELLTQHSNLHFVIAGDGPEELQLKSKAQTLGIAEYVTFTGFVPDITTIYPAFSILLHTSRYEAMPMTILEAMACKIPIVASAVGGIAEILEHGNTALLSPSGDIQSFFSNMNFALTHEEELRRMVDQAHTLVREKYSAQAMTTQIEQLYRDQLSKRKNAR